MPVIDRPKTRQIAFAGAIALTVGALAAALLLSPDDEGGAGSVPDPFAYDPSRPLDERHRDLPGTAALDYVDVGYASFDGRRVRALFAAPAGVAGPHRCVIWEGGLGYELSQFSLPPPLLGAGYAWLSVEPRFSGAQASRRAREPKPLLGMISDTVIDLRRGIDYLEQSGECLTGIGYVGGSFGGLLGALLAGTDERVDAAALLATGGDWRELIAGTPDFLLADVGPGGPPPRMAVRILGPVDPVRWIGRISPRALLMINGREDETVTPAAANALYEAAGGPKEIVWYEGNHFALVGALGQRMYREVRDFLDRELAPGS